MNGSLILGTVPSLLHFYNYVFAGRSWSVRGTLGLEESDEFGNSVRFQSKVLFPMKRVFAHAGGKEAL